MEVRAIKAADIGRNAYGFECERKFYEEAQKLINDSKAQIRMEI